MRLYLKHMWRSLKARPTQPVLIILTVSICVCMCLCAVGLQVLFVRRAEQLENKSTALGDIIITLGGNSEDKVLLVEDAKKILGNNAEVAGDYSVTVFMREPCSKTVRLCAASIAEVDAYMKFDFLEYGQLTDDNLKSSVIISREFAEKNNIKLYDTVRLETLDVTASYTVRGIADDEIYFEDCDVLCDISSVLEILADRAPIIAALGGELTPADRIFVRVSSGADKQAVFEMLSGSESFGDDYISISGSSTRMDLNVRTKTLIVFAVSLIMIMLCGMTIIGAIGFLIKERQSEYAMFMSAGASSFQICGLLLSENFIYSLIGGTVGGAISPYVFDYVASLFSWYDGGVEIGALDLLYGFGVAFALGSFCTLAAIYKRSRAKRSSFEAYMETKKPNVKIPVIYASLIALLGAALYVMPVNYHYIPALVMLIVGILFIYSVFPLIFFGISWIFERIVPRGCPSFLLSQKNVKNANMQKNIGRLVAVMLSLIVSLSFCAGVIDSVADGFRNIITGDIIAVGIPEELKQELADSDCVDGFSDIAYSNSASIDGKYAVLSVRLNGEPENCISDKMRPDKVPEVGEVAVSKGIARLCDLKVGDMLCVSEGGNTYELEICEITDTATSSIFTNSETFDQDTNISIISLSDALKYGETVSYLESKGVLIVEKDILNISSIETFDAVFPLMRVILISALAVSAVGIFNMLSEERAMRRKEREIFALCGMTKRRIFLMNVFEIVYIFAVSALFAGVLGYALFALVNLAAGSFGISFL